MEERDDLKEIVANIPDDNSGSPVSNRYGYQKNWAIYKLLELEQLDKDYMIVMDYHEDIMILDSSQQVENIDFYQVKTRKGDYWRLKELITTGKDANGEMTHSILGKLLKHSLDFSKARDFYFVTDTFLAKGLINKGKDFNKDKIPFSKFKEENQRKSKDCLKEELPELREDVWNHFFVCQEQLKIDDYKSDIIGIIQQFIDKKLPKAEISSSTLYDSLYNEIESLQNHEEAITETNVLMVKKSFKRSDFKAYISKLAKFESYDRKCDRVIDKILSLAPSSEMSFKREQGFKKILKNKIKSYLYDYNNVEFLQLSNLVASVSASCSDLYDGDAWTVGNLALQELNKKYNNYLGMQQDELLALILLEYA